MIKTDRKIISAVLKLTDNYHDQMTIGYNPSSLLLIRNISDVIKGIQLSISEEDAEESVRRLIDAGLLRKEAEWSGGYSFCMTSRLKHRHAFWFDAFAKRFWAGFAVGVITAVTANLLIVPIRSAISALIQLLQRLL